MTIIINWKLVDTQIMIFQINETNLGKFIVTFKVKLVFVHPKIVSLWQTRLSLGSVFV